MHVRPTLPRDIPSLPAIERSAAQAFARLPALAWLATDEVLDEAAHQAFMEAEGSWVAVDAQERPLGFLCARPAGDALHIHELSVRLQAQGQGVGGSLLAQVIRAARHRGIPLLTLTTFVEVPWNAPFYARRGFEVIATDQLGERLRELLAEERRHGLEGRCAMRLVIRTHGALN